MQKSWKFYGSEGPQQAQPLTSSLHMHKQQHTLTTYYSHINPLLTEIRQTVTCRPSTANLSDLWYFSEHLSEMLICWNLSICSLSLTKHPQYYFIVHTNSYLQEIVLLFSNISNTNDDAIPGAEAQKAVYVQVWIQPQSWRQKTTVPAQSRESEAPVIFCSRVFLRCPWAKN